MEENKLQPTGDWYDGYNWTLTGGLPKEFLGRYVVLNDEVKTMPKIEKVTFFENRITKTWFSDGTVVSVDCKDKDEFNPEFGLAMCIAKKYFGSYEGFQNSLKKSRHMIDGKKTRVIRK